MSVGRGGGKQFRIPIGFHMLTFDDFTLRINELRAIIFEGVGYFSAWEGLVGQDEGSLQALNRYKGLFRPAMNAPNMDGN